MDYLKIYENLMMSIMPLWHFTNYTAVLFGFSGLRVRLIESLVAAQFIIQLFVYLFQEKDECLVSEAASLSGVKAESN